MAVNKFIGIGNLGRDPETRFTAEGTAVTNIAIAITEKYKDKSGNQKEVTEWVNIAFFGKLAEIAGQYLHKGSKIYVEGKLKTEKYEKNGETKYSTKIIGEKMEMLGGKDEKKQIEKEKINEPNYPDAVDGYENDDIPF
jgi:single-strand DNA-binding protein